MNYIYKLTFLFEIISQIYFNEEISTFHILTFLSSEIYLRIPRVYKMTIAQRGKLQQVTEELHTKSC